MHLSIVGSDTSINSSDRQHESTCSLHAGVWSEKRGDETWSLFLLVRSMSHIPVTSFSASHHISMTGIRVFVCLFSKPGRSRCYEAIALKSISIYVPVRNVVGPHKRVVKEHIFLYW